MNKVNYQKVLEKELDNIKLNKLKPKLLLHVCCAPCSSYVLEYLFEHFEITTYFYNPNISSFEEYNLRADELKRFVKEKFGEEYIVNEICNYNPDEFYVAVKGMEDFKEGGNRCFTCYELRLDKSAEYAKTNQFDYFTTTLSISPLKNAEKLNEIGARLSEKYGIKYLYSDFKKKNGYKRSIELSNEYHLYRQNFCGCKFSKPCEDLQQY